MREKIFYIYILESLINGKYYIGTTSNLEKRINYHNQGKVRSTKPFIPWKIRYIEKFNSLEKARRRESQIKKWKSRKAIERLFKACSSSG